MRYTVMRRGLLIINLNWETRVRIELKVLRLKDGIIIMIMAAISMLAANLNSFNHRIMIVKRRRDCNDINGRINHHQLLCWKTNMAAVIMIKIMIIRKIIFKVMAQITVILTLMVI